MKKCMCFIAALIVFFVSLSSFAELPNYDASAEARKTDSTIEQKSLQSTVSEKSAIEPFLNKAIPSQYDEYLGTYTFIWVSQNVPKPEVRGMAESVETVARHYLKMFHPGKNHSSESLTSNREVAVIKSIHDTGKGPIIVKFRQQINGIEVFGREYNILMKQDRQLVAVSGYFTQAPLQKISRRSIDPLFGSTAADAVVQAYRDMRITVQVQEVEQVKKTTPYRYFQVNAEEETVLTEEKARVKEVWYELKGELLPAYYLEISAFNQKTGEDLSYSYVISEADGQLLFRKNLIDYEQFTYRTFVNTDDENKPFRGPMGDIYPIVGLDPDQSEEQISLDFDPSVHRLVTLQNGPISTNDPWLPPDATQTRGNNVDAYIDIHPEDGLTSGDFRAETTLPRTFDHAYDPEKPLSEESRKAAIVNLFYMNNWLHDYFYEHGFREEDGNAQNDNYGRGGLDGDELRAEAQDYSGRNNANMRTPADGSPPRMQMYLFNGFHKQGVTFDLEVTSPSGLALGEIRPAAFGPGSFPPISGELVRLVDGTEPVHDGCQPAINPEALRGKIAIIDRGGCNFTVKVAHAQAAGAIAAIVANNRDGTIPAPMGGSDPSIIIPSFGISQNDGSAIYAYLDAGTPVSVTMYRNFVPDRDGTLANGIITHEWGHYLSHRLVGDASGLVNNQGRSMGEGWCDFLAIFFAIKEEHRYIPGNELFQGLYSSGGWVLPSPYFGIRRVPYTTDMSLNATTFKHIDNSVPFQFSHPIAYTRRNSEVHASGEIWANMLLEVYAALLNDTPRLSFQEAKSRMADYITAGMKMTPIAPTFVEGRDGILAVAYATDMNDYWLMLNAFAKRGIGIGAESPDRWDEDHFGVVEAYKTELSSFEVISVDLNLNYSNDDDDEGYCTKDNVLDAGETALLTLTIRNSGNRLLEDVVAVVSSMADIEFEDDEELVFERIEPYSGNHTDSIEFTLESAKVAEEIELAVNFPVNEEDPSVVQPEAQTIRLVVNYDFARANRAHDTMENSLASRHDWKTIVDYAPNTFLRKIAEKTYNLDGGKHDPIYHTGQMWLGTDNGFQSDVSLVSPELKVGFSGDFTISFDHAHIFEDDFWDGGVIEIRVGKGEWKDILEAGGVFEGYGYNGTIRVNINQPLSGRKGYVNSQEQLSRTTVNFGNAYNGQTVQLRFRIGTDRYTGGLGWFIDNISFENITNRPFSKVVRNRDICDD